MQQVAGPFANYTVERELGKGGMATVYLAHDTRHDRQVALKVLRPDVAQSIGAERFLREIQLAAKLSHPHILPLFDSGEANGCLYYVMPNVEGFSLRDRLKTEAKLPIEEALRSFVKSQTRSTTPTGTAWCTAISSRRTSCCTTGMRWWRTSGLAKR
jgi:serine/threonine protein kinase